MSKFLTYKEISLKLDDGRHILNMGDKYLTKRQVVSHFSNEDYDETKLNNVKGDDYFVTDDDIVQSPRYALHVNLDTHVKSVNISVLGGLTPTSDNTSDDNDVSPSSLSGDTIIDGPTIPGGTIIDGPTVKPDMVIGNFIKIGQNKTITKKTSTVYIPAGARVKFSPSYDEGYGGDGNMLNFISMTSERTIDFTSKQITITHTHNNSGTVHVTFNRHSLRDTLSYQVYHTYNNSTCTIKTGNINESSATITTPTYGNTSILFIPSNISPTSCKMRVDSSSNVTATAFQSGGSSTEVQLAGPLLDLKNIKSGWSVNITIYYS